MANEPIQGLPYPLPSDTNDPPRDIKALADAAVTRTNMRFATAGARDAAITAPVDGMECVIGSGLSAVKQIRHNGAWKTVFDDSNWTSVAAEAGYVGTSLAYKVRGGRTELRGVVVRSAGDFTTGDAEIVFKIPASAAPSIELRQTVVGSPPIGIGVANSSTVLTVSTDGTVRMRRGAGPASAPAIGNAYLTGISWSLG